MTPDTTRVLVVLEHALALANDAVDNDGLLDLSHPAAVDLGAILGATDRLLRRYREALDDANRNIDF